MARQFLSRLELYELVWSRPITQLAGEMGLSDVGLAKACKRYEVPRPPRGYWQKLANNKAPPKTTLPPVSEARFEQTNLRLLDESERTSAARVKHAADTDPRIIREHKPANRIVVAEHDEAFPPIVERTVKSLRAAKPDEKGRVTPKAQSAMDVCVTPAQIDRVGCLLSAFVRALEARSISLRVNQSPARTTVVTVDDEDIVLELTEKVGREEHVVTEAEKRRINRDRYAWYRLPQHDYHATGQLQLEFKNLGYRVPGQKTWRDTPTKRLEDRLNGVLIGLYCAAPAIKEARRQSEIRKRQWKEERQRAEIRRQEQLREERRVEELAQRLKLFEKVQQIRAFVESVAAARAAGRLPDQDEAEFEAWLQWAREYADSIDPTRHPEAPFSMEPPHRYAWQRSPLFR